ncbi:hypothetical protein [Arthrobacter sp. UYCo732]|uniref:hypothetical protein n=1 Tax=Arthrobacter sp. UYCo732 TaxID=3156336 RepID=UPI003393E8F3
MPPTLVSGPLTHKLTPAVPADYFLGGKLKRFAALLLLVPVLLAGCAQSPGGSILDAGPAYSKLDGPGVEKIIATKTALLDLRSGKLTRDDTGLGSEAKDAAFEVAEGMDLTILGPKGSIEATAHHVIYKTGTSRESNVIYYVSRAKTDDEFFAILRNGVEKYGLPSHATHQLIRGITNTPEFSGSNDLGVGYATGVAVKYETQYNASSNTRDVGVYVTEQPSYAPAAATPLGDLGSGEDPMSRYVETITTPEEKVARLRAYTALPEILNGFSPVHDSPTSVYKDLFEQGVITPKYRDQNKDQTEWGTGQFPPRDAGYTYQVTAMYCPMHEQTLTVLDRGYLSCAYTGQYMYDGSRVSASTAEAVTGWGTAAADKVQRAHVFMKKDGDIWKVDDIQFES